MAKEQKSLKELLDAEVGSCAREMEKVVADAKKYLVDYGVEVRQRSDFIDAFSRLQKFVANVNPGIAAVPSGVSGGSKPKTDPLVKEKRQKVFDSLKSSIKEVSEVGVSTSDLKSYFNDLDLVKELDIADKWQTFVAKLKKDDDIISEIKDPANPREGSTWKHK